MICTTLDANVDTWMQLDNNASYTYNDIAMDWQDTPPGIAWRLNEHVTFWPPQWAGFEVHASSRLEKRESHDIEKRDIVIRNLDGNPE